MAVKEVLLLGNPFLREEAEEVEEFSENLEKIITDLRDTLVHLQEKHNIGRALAAPQIGYSQRVIYYNQGGEELVLVNPRIIENSSEKFSIWDSCFSFNVAFFVRVSRHRKIKVKFKDEKGKDKILEFEDDLAELFQHEIDHLEGILATDYLEDQKDIIMRKEWEKIK